MDVQELEQKLLKDQKWRELVMKRDKLDHRGELVLPFAFVAAVFSLPIFLSLVVWLLIVAVGVLIVAFLGGIILYLDHKIRNREFKISRLQDNP